MTYQPDPLRHEVLADTASLYCSVDQVYCTEVSPCSCDGAEEAVLPDKAEAPPPLVIDRLLAPVFTPREDLVRLVSSGDAGVSGEKAG